MSQKSSVKKDKANKNGNVKLLAVTNGSEIERDMEKDAEDEHSRNQREREKKKYYIRDGAQLCVHTIE